MPKKATGKRYPIDKIDPDPNQPRKSFNKAKLEGLAASIFRRGLITPISIRPSPNKGRFIITAGERRWRAHRILVEQGHTKFDMIKAECEAISERRQVKLAAIVENLQRDDMTPIEWANAFKELMDDGMTLEEIGQELGIPAWRIEWRVRLLNLAPGILKLFEAGHLDNQQAGEIARLERRDQPRIVRLVNTGKLVGWKPVRNAVEAILNAQTQEDIFGDAAPKPTKADRRTVATMEHRVAVVISMLGKGWKDGECVIAARVDRDKAGLMADQLAAIQKTLGIMERELRNVTAQAQIVLSRR